MKLLFGLCAIVLAASASHTAHPPRINWAMKRQGLNAPSALAKLPSLSLGGGAYPPTAPKIPMLKMLNA